MFKPKSRQTTGNFIYCSQAMQIGRQAGGQHHREREREKKKHILTTPFCNGSGYLQTTTTTIPTITTIIIFLQHAYNQAT